MLKSTTLEASEKGRDLLDYLESKGIVVVAKTGGINEVAISQCPLCKKEANLRSKRFHTYVNVEKGTFVCFTCGQGGNLHTLKRHYGEEKRPQRTFKDSFVSHISGSRDTLKSENVSPSMNITVKDVVKGAKILQSWEKPLQYMVNERGIFRHVLQDYKIGVVPRIKCHSCGFYGVPEDGGVCRKCGTQLDLKKAQFMLSFPYFMKNGKLALVKYRSIPPAQKQFMREPGGVNVPFGLDHIDLKRDSRLWITEAEIDALSLRSMGARNVVSLPNGAGNWNPDWNQYFLDATEIFIATDNDPAGESGAMKISRSLGAWRCKRVIFPEGIKDVNEFLQKGGALEDLKFQSMSKPAWLQVHDMRDAVMRLLNGKPNDPALVGLQTPWQELTNLIGGIRKGELTIITGDTGSGKSMFTSALAYLLARMHGVPVALGSFEVLPDDVLQRVLSMVAGRPFFDLSNHLNELNQALKEIEQVPIYFLNHHGSIELDHLREMVRYAIQAYGVQFIVLDHLHYLLHVPNGIDERRAIDETVREIKRWTVEYGVHIVLVVHPNAGLREDGRVPLNSLKGSSEIKKEADLVMAVYRARGVERFFRQADLPYGATEIRVLKCRSPYGSEGSVWLGFDKQRLRYLSLPPGDFDVLDYLDRDQREQDEGRKKVVQPMGYQSALQNWSQATSWGGDDGFSVSFLKNKASPGNGSQANQGNQTNQTDQDTKQNSDPGGKNTAQSEDKTGVHGAGAKSDKSKNLPEGSDSPSDSFQGFDPMKTLGHEQNTSETKSEGSGSGFDHVNDYDTDYITGFAPDEDIEAVDDPFL